MLTETQRDAFQHRGLLKLEQWLPDAEVAAARAAMLGYFERKGLWLNGAWRLEDQPECHAVNAGAELARGLKGQPAFRPLITAELLVLVRELLHDDAAIALNDAPQLLFTLPNAERWTVPHDIWHIDLPRLGSSGPPGVFAFTFLTEVAPGGGGTLLVAGSHRLLNTGRRVRSKDVKKRLRKKPYFAALMSRDTPNRADLLGIREQVDGVDVEVVELTGRPRDLYLADLRLLHTLAPNAAPVPRAMLTQRFLKASLHGEVYGTGDSASRSPRAESGVGPC